MDAYLLYLNSSITREFAQQILFPKLSRIIKETLCTNEEINIIPQACSKLTGDEDFRLIIKTQANLTLEQQRKLANEVSTALRDDQLAYSRQKPYKTIIKFDPDFELRNCA